MSSQTKIERYQPVAGQADTASAADRIIGDDIRNALLPAFQINNRTGFAAADYRAAAAKGLSQYADSEKASALIEQMCALDPDLVHRPLQA